MSLGDDFRSAFLEEYEKARTIADSEGWAETWGDGTKWACFMLWKTPENGENPLLRRVAHRLGLEYWGQGEPFRVDAAMYESGRRIIGSIPFPIKIAIEHEFNVRTIAEEFSRLIHLRVPLKVIITYATTDTSGQGRRIGHARTQVEGAFRELAGRFASDFPESADSEYLVLIGEETSPKVLFWHTLNIIPAGGECGNWVFRNL